MKTFSLLIVAALLPVLVADAPAQANQMVPGQIRAVKVEGTAWQTTQSTNQRERLKVGDFLRQGNRVETAADGNVLLLFDNGSSIALQPSTSFSISEFLRDPFEAQKVDYKTIKKEPSRSVTKVKVQQGAIYFDIPKLQRGSSYDIGNPVGTAGIRGTAGFVAQNSMGVTEGSVQFQTQTGQTQSLAAGQSTGFTPQGNFGQPPADAAQNMQGAQDHSQNAPQNFPSDPFSGAPQSQSAKQASLTQDQKEALEQAAQQGEEALVEAAKQIAKDSPELAPAAAAAAAALMPEAAPQIAGAVAGVAPSQATSIAQSVAQAAPNQANAISQAVISAAPDANANAVSQAAQQGAQQANQGSDQGGGGGSGGGGGGAPPALPGGFGGGGGGGGSGGGTSGGGSIYGN